MSSADRAPPRRVLMIGEDPERAVWAATCLRELGFEARSLVGNTRRTLKQISEQSPDAIVVEVSSPDRQILESLSILSMHQPTPVVMFSSVEDPDYVDLAVAAGVSSYVAGGFAPERIQSIFDVACARFRYTQRLRAALDEAKTEVAERRVVDAAKRVLMRSRNLTENQAYQHMRSLAMDRGARLVDIAHQIAGSSEAVARK